jgi:hypothetical protein
MSKKRVKALKVIAPLCLLGLLIGFGVPAKQKAKVETPKKVKQGSSIAFSVTTNAPANVIGNLYIQLLDPDGQKANTSGNTLNGTTAGVGYTIPLNGKTGTWRVDKVVFRAGAGGEDKDLTPEGDLTFEVSPHDPLVLPSRATVEIQ